MNYYLKTVFDVLLPMIKQIRYFVCLLLLVGSSAIVSANTPAVLFTASAPKTVVKGQAFHLVYSINRPTKDIRLSEIKGLEIVSDPAYSEGYHTQFINGKRTSYTEIKVTYMLLASEEGTFSIPAATAIVDKKQYQSNAITIKVLPPESGKSTNKATSELTEDNLFVRAVLSRAKVKEQEAVLLTYKLYIRGVDVIDVVNANFPTFKNVVTQDIEVAKDKVYYIENVGGRNYNTVLLKQMMLFPQQSGRLTIDPMSCTVIVRLRVQTEQPRSLIDAYYKNYQDVKKVLSTNSVAIDVSALPQPQPVGFSGGVGDFSIQSQISSKQVEVNTPVTLKVIINGSGNMKFVKDPHIDIPANLESYEPKVNNDFSVTPNGMKGTKTIEYLIIPRHPGTFEIPAFEFSYFDISSNSYQTAKTDTYTLTVEKGSGTSAEGIVHNYTHQEEVRLLATDIRYIKTGAIEINAPKKIFTGSWAFWLCYLVPTFLSLLLLLFFRKQARENADVAFMRTKRANKVARQRLKIAEQHLKSGNKEIFYDEVLKALWGYLCDKLNIPLSELNKENVSVQLAAYNIAQEQIDTFIQLLNNCELERFAPLQNSQAAMDNIYEQTVKVISSLENTIRK